VVLAQGGREKRLRSDAVVLAAGFETSYLLRSLGLVAPLVAVKAYSIHIKNAAAAAGLKYAAHLEAATACLITPYKDASPVEVRVTGIRDLDGFNDIKRPDRLAALLDGARKFVGSDFDPARDVETWSGVMAVSPDDLPITGLLQRFDNVYINTGHGFRGTNYAMPSAAVLTRSLLQRPEPPGVGEPVLLRDAERKCEMECLSGALSPARFNL
jgi:glycine/D-amino acid oxidase-like deaminating enzyme